MSLKPYILILSLLCGPLLGTASAEDYKDKNGFTLGEAVSKIRAQTRGRILSAKTARNNGERIHQIRVLTKDGRVQRFQLRAGKKGRQPPFKRRR